MGWPDARLNFTCMEWDVMLDSLAANDGACDLAMAGVDISAINLAKGLGFSIPTYRGGYKLMVRWRRAG